MKKMTMFEDGDVVKCVQTGNLHVVLTAGEDRPVVEYDNAGEPYVTYKMYKIDEYGEIDWSSKVEVKTWDGHEAFTKHMLFKFELEYMGKHSDFRKSAAADKQTEVDRLKDEVEDLKEKVQNMMEKFSADEKYLCLLHGIKFSADAKYLGLLHGIPLDLADE